MHGHWVLFISGFDSSFDNPKDFNYEVAFGKRMNPFMNPIFLTKAIKGYVVDIGRLRSLNEVQLKRYKDKLFRKTIEYAYTVPVYHNKYKDAGIHLSDIKRIEDIEKLPFITKDDLRDNYPNGLIPPDFDKSNGFELSTSGSTGKPVTIFRDSYSILHDLWGFIRELREYDVSWRKHRMTFLADLTPGAVGSAHMSFSNSEQKKTPLLSFNNFQTIDIGEDVEKMIKKMDEFKPEFISGYPDVLQGLAILKQKGYGKNVNPFCIQSTGAVLSDHVRDYLGKTFNCEVFDSYSSTEVGPAVFECRDHKYHIHDDMIHLEFVDKNMKPVGTDKPGNVVVTRLAVGGTPVIRYTGNDDIMVPIKDKCSCGSSSTLVKNIGGRTIDTIILSDGTIIPPLSLTGIPSKVMHDMKTELIQQFQIIQRKIDQIEVLIIINKDLKEKKVFINKVLNEVEKRFIEKLGKEVKVVVKEVDKVERTNGMDRIVRQVISLVDHKLD